MTSQMNVQNHIAMSSFDVLYASIYRLVQSQQSPDVQAHSGNIPCSYRQSLSSLLVFLSQSVLPILNL
ncbi:Uncharacterised protein [Acinetobacter baumannii]|nr:Uncharacterised protein [Acinetobacter baumannii]